MSGLTSKGVPSMPEIPPKQAHPVFRFVDRNDTSTSIPGLLIFLGTRFLFLALIYLGFFKYPDVALSQLRSLPTFGKYFLHTSPNMQRMRYLGLCCAVTAIRQIFWRLCLYRPHFGAIPSAMVGFGVPVYHLLMTALGIAMNHHWFGTPHDYAGLGLVALGSFLETMAEVQRTIFKSDSRNANKVYTGGFFAFARHINYFGELLIYSGYALLATNSWGLAAGIFVMQCGFFCSVAIPELSEHMENKYKTQWENYKNKTVYRLIPLVI